MRRLFSFPNPVNDTSARLVAGGVVIMSLTTIVLGFFGQRMGLLPGPSHAAWWLTVVIAYGFVARVLTGPKLSPLGLLVTKVLTPALHRPVKAVPGPPKRFAQGVGVVFSVTAAVLALVYHAYAAAALALGFLVVAATLESVFAFCLGCSMFRALMRIGVIPEEVCVECNNIWARQRPTVGAGA
ncbi:MAG TPA: DUF4395 domain-containing protein [Micromonosporaceae bacterium]